jgi:DNA ligase D
MSPKAESTTVLAAGREVTISSPSKVFFSERGETKLDLVNYYLAIEEPLMRAIGGRPLLLERYPQGAGGPSFFQKRIPDSAPDWLQTAVVSTPNGTTSNALVAADIAHVLWAVNQGCLGFHVWPYLITDPAHTDELRIDLDPSPGIDFDDIREATREVRGLLDDLGLVGYIKTSGKRGIHIYMRLEPRWDSYDVRAAAVTLARELEKRRPDFLTAAWWKEERGKRVFIDFNQNAPHKTVFGVWSARPRVGAQVSTPIEWDEIDDIHPDDLTIVSVPDRVTANGNPWQAMNDAPQSIAPLVEQFHTHIAEGGTDAPWPPVYPKMPHEPPRVAPSRAKK